MNHCSLNYIAKRASVCLWLLIVLPLLAGALEAPSQDSLTRGDLAFALSDGVIVGPEKIVVYQLEPGALVARSVDTGDVIWQRGVAWKPLGFFGDHLIALAVQSQSRRANLLFVESANGQTVDQIELTFPAPTRPLLTDLPNHQFNVHTWRDGADVLLGWDYASTPLRGMTTNADDGAAPTAAGSSQSTGISDDDNGRIRVQGVFRIDVVDSIVTPLDNADPVTSALAFDPLIASSVARSIANAERTFQSRDGRHRLVSKRISTEDWNRYSWSLTDATVGSVLGQLAQPFAYAPFFVAGNQLIHIAPPTLLRDATEGKYTAKGLRLVVTDLASGEPRWSTELSDPEYRGVLPP